MNKKKKNKLTDNQSNSKNYKNISKNNNDHVMRALFLSSNNLFLLKIDNKLNCSLNTRINICF